MFVHTDVPEAPWYVVEADDKPRARLNCMAHLLSMIPYEERRLKEIEVPPARATRGTFARHARIHVRPDHAASLLG